MSDPLPDHASEPSRPEHARAFAEHPILGTARGDVLARLLGLAEDAVYMLTALVLVAASVYALVAAATGLLGAALAQEGGTQPALAALDQLLVALIFVELFYTVRLSIREHILAVEPFVAVALIATVRRILVLTAEEHRVVEGDPAAFQRLLLELGVLAGLILVLAGAMLLLRQRNSSDRGHAIGR